MRKNDNVRILDMLCRARRVVKSTHGVDIDTFAADTTLQDSVLYNIQIIGEAAAHISAKRKEQHLEIPWNRIIGTRNVVVHEYDGIDYSIVWDIVQNHIPELINSLEAILKREDEK